MTAYQSASGLMNLFIPTSAVVMGGLAIARVPYVTYLRWVWPLLALLTGLVVIVLAGGGAVTSYAEKTRVNALDMRARVAALMPTSWPISSASWQSSVAFPATRRSR